MNAQRATLHADGLHNGVALRVSRLGLPLPVYLITGLAAAVCLVSTNPVLTLGSVMTLLVLMHLLWRPAEPPVLVFAASYQWLQVVTLVLLADYRGQPISALSPEPRIEDAIWLSLIGLISLAFGMRLGVKKLKPVIEEQQQLLRLSVDRIFILYLFTAVFASMVPYLVWRFLSVAQFLLALANLKWVFYVLLGYITLRRRTKVAYFVIATLLEFVAGIGFFADFKTVFFVAALVLLSLQIRVTVKTVVLSTLIVGIVFVAGLAWMTIREDYRSFLNRGTGQQVVLVSPVEQVQAFGDMMTDIDANSLSSSVDAMFKRLAYVDFFAAVLDYVPRQRAYEGGTLLWRSVMHVLMPRFLWRDKAVLESDSDVTMRYTGLVLASADRGTSIGMGYMAEAYIDFGPLGMFIPIVLIGLLWGWMYAFLVSHAPNRPMGLAFGTALLLNATQFEIAGIKLLGGMVGKFLVLAIVLRFGIPAISRWLSPIKSRALQ
jgi:hypothetical protein